MSDSRETLRGILAMLACCFFFILNDSFIKLAGATLPLGEIIFLRGLITLVVLVAVAWKVGVLHGLVANLTRLVVLRTLGEVGATIFYLTALLHLPIANTSAIAQAVPLMLTAVGAIFLGERVGWRRWTAIAVGFVGIMIIVRPGPEGFNAFGLLVLGSNFMIVLREISTRFIPATTSTVYLILMTSIAVTLLGAGMSVTEDWKPVTAHEGLLITAAAATVIFGWLLAVVAMRHGDISVIAPFRYSFIPYAIVVGWIGWGDIPDALTLLGIAIVVAAGVYTFYRSRMVGGGG